MKKILLSLVSLAVAANIFGQVEFRIPYDKRVVYENDSVVQYWRVGVNTFSKAGEVCVLPKCALIEVADTLLTGEIICFVSDTILSGMGEQCEYGVYFAQKPAEMAEMLDKDCKVRQGGQARRNQIKAAISKHKEKKRRDKEEKAKKKTLPNPAMDSPAIDGDAPPKSKKKPKKSSKKG